MINNLKLTPITGTFVSPMLGDTGINNYGLEEWETDFKLMRAIGIDTVIVICCEMERGGQRFSAMDPRSTTWPEDPDLLSMFFRLSEKYGMKLYLGGTLGITNLHLGEWRKEVHENEIFYGKMLSRFGHYSCFQGLYVSLEALPWHFNFFDVMIGVIEAMRRLAPEKKTLISPSFFPLTGNMSSRYSLEEFKRVWGSGFFEKVAGKLDYCAPQDTLDYRGLYMKLQAASPYAEKLITFEFTSCISPNSEWGSSARLFDRYLEMTGLDKKAAHKILNSK
ncbi:MAG: DUF4434 domain-containing protein [Lentisphaerae bacterium]|nr:DUF4434 domain-containing protein [Lentisphaerota bacterium]